MFCPYCGKTVEEGNVFCSNCGAKVGETLQRVPPIAKLTKGFLASLFDFSFTDFITTKILRFLYILDHIVC